MDTHSAGGLSAMSIMWILMTIMVVSEIAMWWMMSKMHKKMFKRIEVLEAALSTRQVKEL